MTKKSLRLFSVAVVLFVAIGICAYFYEGNDPAPTGVNSITNNQNIVTQTKATNISNEASSNTQVQQSTPDNQPQAQAVFYGTLLKQIGNADVGSEPSQQFQVEVSPGPDPSSNKGNVSGTVVVSIPDSNRFTPKTGLRWQFYATFDSKNNWYTVTSAGILIQ